MREILKKLFKLYFLVILIFVIGTYIIYFSNKSTLVEEFGRILTVENSEIILKASNKMELNFKLIKMYEYFWIILSVLAPYIYIKLGVVNYIENKVRGSQFKRLYMRGLVFAATFFLLYNSLKLIKLLFEDFVRNYILYGKWYIGKYNLLEEVLKYNNLTVINFILVGIILFYYYKTSKRWYIVIWSMLFISNLIGGYIGGEIPRGNERVNKTNIEFIQIEGEIKEKFDLRNIEVGIVKNEANEVNINAYAVGYFNSNKIYVLENAVNNLNSNQYKALIAHEYAHVESEDVLKSIIVGGIIDLVGLFIAIEIFKRLKGLRSRGNKELFIILLIINIVFLFLNPIKLSYSRYQESKADTRAMEVLGEGESNLYLQYKLIENTSIPVNVKGLYKWLFYTHPSAIERIENAKNFRK